MSVWLAISSTKCGTQGVGPNIATPTLSLAEVVPRTSGGCEDARFSRTSGRRPSPPTDLGAAVTFSRAGVALARRTRLDATRDEATAAGGERRCEQASYDEEG